MSALDSRRIEIVKCAGIPVATFLSDDRETVLVSISDIAEGLAMDVDLEDADEYVAYDGIGTRSVHKCITHSRVNEFLWMNACNPAFAYDLEEFRKFFSYEVMSFWQRFQPAAASLSARDALKVLNRRTSEHNESLDLPRGRVWQFCFESLGYERAPLLEDLTTEEMAFTAYSELLYASVAAFEQGNGATASESMQTADNRLAEPLGMIGRITRSI